MKYKLLRFALLSLLVMLFSGNAYADFKDFAVDLRDANGGILTADEASTSQAITFGIAVDDANAVNRVAADAANAVAVITGNTGNNHGLQSFSATVPVSGSVQITMSTCSWGGNVTVTNSNGETVATFSTQKGEGGSGCYKGNGMSDENIISAKYVGEATTLTISGGAYVGFFAVSAVSASAATVSYSLGDVTCEGTVVPTGGTYAIGDSYTIPENNTTLYKEGYTLTGWTDGTTDYSNGMAIALEGDLALTPVFTKNTVSLSDRTEEVTLKWDFEPGKMISFDNVQNKTGIFVVPATIGENTIDVKMDWDTNNGGKLNNNRSSWCQANNNTTFTIPSCKGATVAMKGYNAFGRDGKTATTIDGQSDYTSSTDLSYTVAGTTETVAIVLGNDAEYISYVQVTLPVVQSAGGESYTNEEINVEWPMNDPTNYTNSTVSKEGLFATVGVDLGDVRLMDQNGTVNATGTSTVSSGVTFSQMRPTNNASDYVTWVVKPAAGLTFTPTKVTAYIVRFGTDAENGVTISAKAGEGDALTLGNYTAPRNNKSKADDKYGKNANYPENGYVVINLTEEQQTALASGDALSIMGTIGVGNTKAGGIAKVTVSGLINGTKEAVAKYSLALAASPEAGGSVSKYPNSDEYEEGTEVTLTATENFGYDFVNWTNSANEEVSTEAKFKYTVNANETLTANFKAVETYELNYSVDGTNSYMVTVSPAPTVVDGKNMYEAGSIVELTANQYEGLVTFTNWSDGETNSVKKITMDENKTITANYSEIDIIAGWDFYKAGNNGRVADFASDDNIAAALNLVLTSDGTTTTGWLDKSTAKGGYESFTGAAVNWVAGTKEGDVGNYHWQTKINAEAFKDIKVQFQMLYNYNAYQTYLAEYSLNGETWTNFGSITMTGRKQAVSFNEPLPEACNNQATIYIRMRADKENSNVDPSDASAGTAYSKNDGNTLAMFFITGTEQAAYDAVAPALLSSVPENGATGASASGKIVLNFDKKVQLAEGAKATLGELELTPSVSGKVITFEYKGLEYGTEYTFSLPANSVKNLSDIALAKGITLTFTTMERPTVTKGDYDVVVSTTEELLAAITAANSRSDQNTRYRIFIKKGNYTIPLYETTKSANGYNVKECITFITGKNISFIGEDRDEVIITNGIPADATFAGTYGTTSKYDGIGTSDVFQISGSGLYWQDLTVETGMEDGTGRDIAIQDRGTKNIYKNVALRGYQDTWTSNNNNGLYYFEGGYVRGRTDYMCGKGDIYFNEVELRQIQGGYAAVPSTPAKIGWVYKDCVINGEESPAVTDKYGNIIPASDVDGNYTLGRPWGKGTPAAFFIDTKMNVIPSAIGWSEMSGGFPKQFAEYNSTTKTGTTIDLSGRKKTFDAYDDKKEVINETTGEKETVYTNRRDEPNDPVLTAEEAATYSVMSNMFGDWDPTLATEQAPVPANVKIEGTTLSWDANKYALNFAICVDGDVQAFTTDNTFDVSTLSSAAGAKGSILTTTPVYSVRAANEMGGLSEATVATVTDGINEVNASAQQNTSDAIYNIAGQRVSKATKGIYIIGGKKVVIK